MNYKVLFFYYTQRFAVTAYSCMCFKLTRTEIDINDKVTNGFLNVSLTQLIMWYSLKLQGNVKSVCLNLSRVTSVRSCVGISFTHNLSSSSCIPQ